MVEDLDKALVFVRQGSIVDIDKTIGAAGEEARWLSWVKAYLGDIVIVCFHVPYDRNFWGTVVPGTL